MLGRTVAAVAAILLASRSVPRRRYRLVLVLLLLYGLQKLLHRHQRRLLRAYLVAIGERPSGLRAVGIAARAAAAVGTLRRSGRALVERPGRPRARLSPTPDSLLLQVTISQLTVRNVRAPEQGLWKALTDLPIKLFWRVEAPPPYVEVRWGRGERARVFRAYPAAKPAQICPIGSPHAHYGPLSSSGSSLHSSSGSLPGSFHGFNAGLKSPHGLGSIGHGGGNHAHPAGGLHGAHGGGGTHGHHGVGQQGYFGQGHQAHSWGSANQPHSFFGTGHLWGLGGGMQEGAGRATAISSDSTGGNAITFDGVFRFEDSATLAKLERERLRLIVRIGGREAGRIALPLEAMVCGPAPNDHRLLTPRGEPTGGRIAFQCRVSEQREWTLCISHINIKLAPEAFEALSLDGGGSPIVFGLSYTFTSGSSSGDSREAIWRSPTTRLVLPSRGGVELSWRSVEATAAEQAAHYAATSLSLAPAAACTPADTAGEGFVASQARGAVAARASSPAGLHLHTCTPVDTRSSNNSTESAPTIVEDPVAVDELPPIVHSGAFWELRHGALRVQLAWHRADRLSAVRPKGVHASSAHTSPSIQHHLSRQSSSPRLSPMAMRPRPSLSSAVSRPPAPPSSPAAVPPSTAHVREATGTAPAATTVAAAAAAAAAAGAAAIGAGAGTAVTVAAAAPAGISVAAPTSADPSPSSTAPSSPASIAPSSPSAMITGRRRISLPSSVQPDSPCGSNSSAPFTAGGSATQKWRLEAPLGSTAGDAVAAFDSSNIAKSWLVMEKVFSQLPESADLRRRRRAHRLVHNDESLLDLSSTEMAGVSPSPPDLDAPDRFSAATVSRQRDSATSNEARAGLAKPRSGSEQAPIPLPFSEDLYLNGKIIGRCSGVMLLVGQPSVVQQAYGTHTEGGTQFAAPLVMDAVDSSKGARATGSTGGTSATANGGYGGYAGIRSRLGRGGGGGSAEARRLASLCEELSRALHRDDGPARERAVGELAELLHRTHKGGGVLAYVYRDSTDLAACRETMLDLWELLLRSLEEGALRFDARNQAYDLLRLLLRRAELSTTMQDDGSSNSTPTHQILLWLELSQRTLSWTLLAVDQPAVKHTDHSSGLLSICAQLMALSFFRLPSFARALIDALQAEDVLEAHIPEFRGIAFSLDCSSELSALAQRGFSHHPPLDWMPLHRTAAAAANVVLARHAAPTPTGDAPWAFGARTKARIPNQAQAALAAQAAAQRGAAAHLAEVLRCPAWRDRMRRRGHLFCTFFYEWMQVVCDSLSPGMPPHFFPWPRLPGFTTLLTCTLLEMSARPPQQLSEPLVQLSNELLRCTHLHSVMVKIIFTRCSVHDVRAVSTTLNLMNTWMSALLRRLQEDRERPAEAAPLSQPLLRSTFDFAFFFRGMAVLFDSEHVQVLLKACEFLYRHFDLLPDHQADKMRTIILRGCLHRLQLHWSAEVCAPVVFVSSESPMMAGRESSSSVRSFFTHLLVFRLEQPCGWSVPRLPSEPEPTPVDPTIQRQYRQCAERLATLARMPIPARRPRSTTDTNSRFTQSSTNSTHPSVLSLDLSRSSAASSASGRSSTTGCTEEAAAEAQQGRLGVGGSTLLAGSVSGVGIEDEAPLLAELAHLRPYAPAANALYIQLTQVRQGIQRELQLWARGASPGAPPSLPVLKCDTSVLDLEEDRVIWVRESELGKGIIEVP